MDLKLDLLAAFNRAAFFLVRKSCQVVRKNNLTGLGESKYLSSKGNISLTIPHNGFQSAYCLYKDMTINALIISLILFQR